MEPKGEFLLQLLQGRGSAGNTRNTSSSGGGGRRVNGASSSSSSEDVERSPVWQHRDPAVAALGPSHSYHAGEPLLHQQQQPNQLFVAPPPQYSGGVWTSAPPPQQQQQQFFGFGGVHAGGPHPLIGNRYPPYPPPPSAHLAEQWRPETSEFTRRSDAAQGWLPPPRGGNDVVAPRQWSQGSMQKAPPPPPQQQFLGNGKELLQLLLGGGSQNLKPQNPQAPEEVHVVDHALPRAALVHGPIGPPKRGEPTSSGGEDLLGRFWALPNGSSSDLIMNPNLSVAEEQIRTTSTSSLSGGVSPDPSKSKVSKPPGFFAERDGFPIDRNFVSSTAKALNHFSGVAKGPLAWNDGFQDDGTTTDLKLKTNAGDDRGNYHIQPNAGRFVVSAGRAREDATDLKLKTNAGDDRGNYHIQPNPGRFVVSAGRAREDATDLKLKTNAGDDRGNYHIQPNPGRFVVSTGRARENAHSKTTGQARDDSTSLSSADVTESSSSPSRELGRMGVRGSGRRGGGGGAGRAEVGRRSSSGQWMAVNEKPRARNSEREASTTTSNLHGPDASASAADENAGGSSSSYASPQSAAKATAADESPSGSSSSGGKSKEEMKRRRGQAQEWRMKQASPPHSHSKPSADPGSQGGAGLPSEGILPLASQVDRPGLPSNTVRHSMPGSATDESKQQLQYQLDEGAQTGGRERAGRHLFENGRLTWEDGVGGEDEEDVSRELHFFSGYAKLVEDTQHLSTTPPVTHNSKDQPIILTREETEVEEKPGNLRDSREVRRHQPRMNVPTNTTKGDVQRLDFEAIRLQLLAIYKNLIPTQEEVQGQRKFLTQLDRLVSRDWSGAKLFLFGSCANDFGVRNSDIDVCLSVDDEHSSKAELVTRMAAILRSVDMQNVQALTHARVPIVKFTDSNTGINCDICVNNMLAVVNSKLLHDYSQVDPRLRQLAFLVKHWAKRRQVNETYRGTLSSYAYVLMCIHFLQQRRPAILPCLQSMQPTYEVTVGTIKCAYFDKVNTLKNFGARNKESVAELLTYFFEYWASCHDYNRWVISVRTGGYLSKDEKDWTRRIGNERHLICIEDPFEITHDLGRVVDRHSIRVLRDEFKRAARILRQDSSPATTLFEPFIREKA